jgi:hypothetical protein
MRRPELTTRTATPSLAGLLLGSGLAACVVLVSAGAIAIAQSTPADPQAVLEASHLPPLLTIPGERVQLAFDVHCAREGVADPEQSCPVVGSLYLRAGASGHFEAMPLQEVRSDGVRRLTAVVPSGTTNSRDGFEYYAEIDATDTGDRLRVPPGEGVTYHSYSLRDVVEVELAPIALSAPRHGSRIVSARWGDDSTDVGIEGGRSADPMGASSFDVAPDGSVMLLDEAHRRALRWTPGSRPTRIPLSISGRLADMTLGSDDSIYVLETVGSPARAPQVRKFGPAGRALGVVDAAEASPSQIRMSSDGPVVLQHPSHLWMPVESGDMLLDPKDQRRRARVGRPLRGGSEVVSFRAGDDLRVALLVRGRVQRAWRLTCPDRLAEVQLAEPSADGLVVVVRVYDDDSDQFRVLTLDRSGIVDQFSVNSADWAETAPLSRFRLRGRTLYQLGSNPAGAFVDAYELEVD